MFRAFVGFSEPGLMYVRLFSSSRGMPAQRLWNRQRHLGRGLFSPFGGFRARLSRSEHLDGKRFPSNWTRTVRDVGEDVFVLWHVVPPVGRRPSRLHDATASRLSTQRR